MIRAHEDGSMTLDNASVQRLMDYCLLHYTDYGWYVGRWPKTNTPPLARTEADRRQQGALMPSEGREPEKAPISDTLTPLKVQWRSEHRYLAKEKQRIEQRMKELEEMLESFFGEASRG